MALLVPPSLLLIGLVLPKDRAQVGQIDSNRIRPAKAHLGGTPPRQPLGHTKIGSFCHVEPGVEAKMVRGGKGDDGLTGKLHGRGVPDAGFLQHMR